jgi:hypothetical protein
MVHLNRPYCFGGRALEFALLAGLSACAFSTQAAPPGWPASPRPELRVQMLDAVADGVPVRISELVGAGLRIRLDAVGGWDHAIDESNSTSFMLAHRSNPAVHLGFSVFDTKEFLPSLDSQHWDGYINSIRTTCEGRLTELEEYGGYDGGGDMFVFGLPYREVVYTFQERPGGLPRCRREIFVFLADRLLVITLDGESEPVQALGPALALFIARLEVIP